ncbi:MAG: hypothetical protein ACJA13_001603 [Paraglaciecola sp.]|jgi:hypothetical protein
MRKTYRYAKLFILFGLTMSIHLSTQAEDTIAHFSPVLLEDLDQERGLGGVADVTNNEHLEAILTNNSNSNSITGNNTIDAGSFSEASGVFSIIQNTGNNVIIQDSTIITVTITPN